MGEWLHQSAYTFFVVVVARILQDNIHPCVTIKSRRAGERGTFIIYDTEYASLYENEKIAFACKQKVHTQHLMTDEVI
jgi:hypothetical protein